MDASNFAKIPLCWIRNSIYDERMITQVKIDKNMIYAGDQWYDCEGLSEYEYSTDKINWTMIE